MFSYRQISVPVTAIKAERPAAAMASFLVTGVGFYRHPVYVEEAKRLGLFILPPDVNASEWFCTSPEDGKLMIGMGYLTGMGEAEFEKNMERKTAYSSSTGQNSGYWFEACGEYGHGRLL
ncbi:MAG: hypothetical protein KAR40_10100 [Candidatus Sabulitectum sp.]|nr:hypothetical protein [Candidatus Sabulitectum sp.]